MAFGIDGVLSGIANALVAGAAHQRSLGQPSQEQTNEVQGIAPTFRTDAAPTNQPGLLTDNVLQQAIGRVLGQPDAGTVGQTPGSFDQLGVPTIDKSAQFGDVGVSYELPEAQQQQQQGFSGLIKPEEPTLKQKLLKTGENAILSSLTSPPPNPSANFSNLQQLMNQGFRYRY